MMIKLEEGNISEYSEDIYEVIEHPENNQKAELKAKATSDPQSDQDNPFFLSISKGRRNHLKLHRYFDWDIDSDIVQATGDIIIGDVVDEGDTLHIKGVVEREGHSRLLPFLNEEEVSVWNEDFDIK